MVNIKENVHTSTTIVSLDRALRKAEIYGDLKLEDLYLLSTVYALLNTLCLNLTNTQRKQLITIYNKLSFKSKDVCTSIMLKAFQQPMKNKFSQGFVDPSTVVKNTSIDYWTTSFNDTYEDILESIDKSFINTTKNESRASFMQGVTITPSNVGRFAFFINTLDHTNITIKDYLDNDVTSQFNVGYVQSLNGVLIVSKLLYTTIPMLLKIEINA